MSNKISLGQEEDWIEQEDDDLQDSQMPRFSFIRPRHQPISDKSHSGQAIHTHAMPVPEHSFVKQEPSSQHRTNQHSSLFDNSLKSSVSAHAAASTMANHQSTQQEAGMDEDSLEDADHDVPTFKFVTATAQQKPINNGLNSKPASINKLAFKAPRAMFKAPSSFQSAPGQSTPVSNLLSKNPPCQLSNYFQNKLKQPGSSQAHTAGSAVHANGPMLGAADVSSSNGPASSKLFSVRGKPVQQSFKQATIKAEPAYHNFAPASEPTSHPVVTQASIVRASDMQHQGSKVGIPSSIAQQVAVQPKVKQEPHTCIQPVAQPSAQSPATTVKQGAGNVYRQGLSAVQQAADGLTNLGNIKVEEQEGFEEDGDAAISDSQMPSFRLFQPTKQAAGVPAGSYATSTALSSKVMTNRPSLSTLPDQALTNQPSAIHADKTQKQEHLGTLQQQRQQPGNQAQQEIHEVKKENETSEPSAVHTNAYSFEVEEETVGAGQGISSDDDDDKLFSFMKTDPRKYKMSQSTTPKPASNVNPSISLPSTTTQPLNTAAPTTVYNTNSLTPIQTGGSAKAMDATLTTPAIHQEPLTAHDSYQVSIQSTQQQQQQQCLLPQCQPPIEASNDAIIDSDIDMPGPTSFPSTAFGKQETTTTANPLHALLSPMPAMAPSALQSSLSYRGTQADMHQQHGKLPSQQQQQSGQDVALLTKTGKQGNHPVVNLVVSDTDDDDPSMPGHQRQPASHNFNHPQQQQQQLQGHQENEGQVQWWQLLPDFVPLELLKNGADPRDGSFIHILYKEQFTEAAASLHQERLLQRNKRQAALGLPQEQGHEVTARGGDSFAKRRRKANGSDNTPAATPSAGHWYTDGTGSKVFVDASGKRSTGKAAYRAYQRSTGKKGGTKKRRTKKTKKSSSKRKGAAKGNKAGWITKKKKANGGSKGSKKLTVAALNRS